MNEIYRQQETKDQIQQLGRIIVEQYSKIERLKALCARAADALAHESWVSEEQCGLPSQFVELIAELRKTAE